MGKYKKYVQYTFAEMTVNNMIRITGHRCHDGLYCVYARLWIPTFRQYTPSIEFVLDTGAYYTTIEYDDAIKLGLDKIQGESEPIATEDGETDNIRMRSYISVFIRTGAGNEHFEMLPNILRRRNPTRNKQGQIMTMPNLLGIDFLRRFRLSFDDAHVYLERSRVDPDVNNSDIY
ncbi:MAG TPA: hypothetical protein VEL11_04870 [Candidatus Bathyarchaeia archaeon]|nr:hypothetical protein [Candidatus Bathyarchaeia archaeon]